MKKHNEDRAHDKHFASEHERLCAYLLGELAQAEQKAMEQSLESDPALRAERDRLAATIGLVTESCSDTQSLSPAILEMLERKAAPVAQAAPRVLGAPLRMAAGLAAIVTGVVAGRALMQPTPPAAQENLASLEKSPRAAGRVTSLAAPSKAAPSEANSSAVASHAKGVLSDKVRVLGERQNDVAPSRESTEAGSYRGPGDAVPPGNGLDPDPLGALEALGYVQSAGRPPTQSRNGLSSPPAPSTQTAGQSLSLSLRVVPTESSPARKARKRVAGRGGAYHLGTGVWTRGESEVTTGADDFFLGHGQRWQQPALSLAARYEQRTRSIFDDCVRLSNETPKDMFFRFWGDNAFELTQVDGLSTFGLDVDTASYTLARRYLNEGNLPTKEQIRTEEFLNYFKPDLPAPTEDVFGIHTELAPSRFGNGPSATSQRWLLRVGVRGQEIAREDRKALTLTFIVDTSGSMKEGQRLELVKHALRLLVAQLDAGDSIAIVAFNMSTSLVLPMTSVQNRGIIEAALYGLTPGGGTNAEAGLRFGYEVAAAALTPEAHNRVVFLSDGVANIGQVNQDRLNESIRARRESGIYLNTIGVGMSNHNDAFLEQLANKGDGICNYVDSAAEARRALVDNFTGAFQPIARDVKLQVEFDASQVYRYRLLGYENRAIADADFRNDAVDAGEVGAGHQVVALYELELTGSQSDKPLAQVNLRWKEPTGAGRDPLEDQATERNQAVLRSSATAWEGASLGYRRSTLVAQFAEVLRRSVHARGDSLDELIAESVRLAAQLKEADFTEFVQLLQRSRELIVRHAPIENDLSNCIDSLRHNRILRAQLEDLRRTENKEVLGQLERNNAELEAKIRDLIRTEMENQPR